METCFTIIDRMGRSRVIITASGGMRGSKRVDLKKIVDAAAKVALDKGHKARHAQAARARNTMPTSRPSQKEAQADDRPQQCFEPFEKETCQCQCMPRHACQRYVGGPSASGVVGPTRHVLRVEHWISARAHAEQNQVVGAQNWVCARAHADAASRSAVAPDGLDGLLGTTRGHHRDHNRGQAVKMVDNFTPWQKVTRWTGEEVHVVQAAD